ncbi:carbohydrate kinase [Rarobacter faecitabidus]|uniref:Fructokinase n=1 Tax=Rarobacter faecitabidus TaxID=13243 RepID=A0A542ZUD9_RARFA|nr:carbohydrate kinase [Rarobacter faecitabidus]TQL63975.1 fructokinase [Rarobacter faecitabidus]
MTSQPLIGEPPVPYRKLVIGEALIDVVQQTDGTVREHCGGSPANVAIALGRLGHAVDLITWLGKDAYADILRDWLTDSGVTITAGTSAAPYTPLATAVLDHDGSATYTFDLTWDLDTSAQIPADTAVIHVGSLAATLEPGSDKVYELMRTARGATTVFDPNIRPSLVSDPEETRRRVERFFDASDVVRASDVDLLWLYPYTDPIEVARRLVRDRRPSLVVVTQGPQGATAVTEHLELHTPTAATTVVDRVGAGDAATGAVIDGLSQAGLLGSENRERLANIDRETLQAILDWAAQLCAYCLSKQGANMPRRTDLTTTLALPTGVPK